MEDNACRACNPSCKKDCTECEKEWEEFERWQDVEYSKALAEAYEDPAERNM